MVASTLPLPMQENTIFSTHFSALFQPLHPMNFYGQLIESHTQLSRRHVLHWVFLLMMVNMISVYKKQVIWLQGANYDIYLQLSF